MTPVLRWLWRVLRETIAIAVLFSFVLLLYASAQTGWPAVLSQNSPERRLAALGDLLAADALVFALAGVLTALLAYSFTIQRPSLKLELTVGEKSDEFAVSTMLDQSGNFREIAVHPLNSLSLILVGKNDVSARNPAVRVSATGGLAFLSAAGALGAGWSALQATVVQWDGGVDSIVHGGWSRSIPSLPLGGSRLTDNG